MSDALNKKVKVVFPLDEGPAETMWARVRGDGLLELDSIPLFAYGVSLGDVIAVQNVDGDPRPYFASVVTPSGKTTYRVTVEEQRSTTDLRAIRPMLEQAKDLAEAHADYGDDYLALVASTDEERESIERLLRQGEQRGYWDWEISTAAPSE